MTTTPHPDQDHFDLRSAAEEIAILARCLDVGDSLAKWSTLGDPIAGAIAADGLDQAIGLLEELSLGRAQELAATAKRLLNQLPPPLE